jgi:hypothetical protein
VVSQTRYVPVPVPTPSPQRQWSSSGDHRWDGNRDGHRGDGNRDGGSNASGGNHSPTPVVSDNTNRTPQPLPAGWNTRKSGGYRDCTWAGC